MARSAVRPGHARRGRRRRRHEPADPPAPLRVEGRTGRRRRRLAAAASRSPPAASSRATLSRRSSTSSTATRRWATPTCACSSSRGGSPPSTTSSPSAATATAAGSRPRSHRSYPPAGARRAELVMTLYAATDVTVWKLLRRDLGRTRGETTAIIRNLVEGATGTPRPIQRGPAMTSSTPQRYLLPMWEGGGTVAPALGVARRLIARGHSVHVLGDPTIRDQAEHAGCAFTPWTSAPHRTSLDPAQDLLEDWTTSNPLAMLARVRDRFVAGPAEAFAADTAAAIDDVRPDVVVPDYLLFGAVIAAQAADVPVVPIVPNIWTLPSPGVPALGPGFPLAKGRPGRWRDAALRSTVNALFDRGLPPLNAARTARGLPPLRSFYDQVLDTERILVLTSPGFDFASPAVPANVSYTGPILDEPAWAEAWTGPAASARRRSAGARRVQLDVPAPGPVAAARRRCAVDHAGARGRHVGSVAEPRRRDAVRQRDDRAVGAARRDPAIGVRGDHALRPWHRHEGTCQRCADGLHPDGPRPERHGRPRRPPRGRRATVTQGVHVEDRGRRRATCSRIRSTASGPNGCRARSRRRLARSTSSTSSRRWPAATGPPRPPPRRADPARRRADREVRSGSRGGT